MDPLQYRPNPQALVSKLDTSGGQAGQGADGLYKPPRLNPVAMEEDPDKSVPSSNENLPYSDESDVHVCFDNQGANRISRGLGGAPLQSRHEC